MANYDSFADIKVDVLFRMDELATGSDFDTYVERAIVRAFHDLKNRHPWLNDQKYPPGSFVTTDDITNLTITVSSTGTSVAGTLSAAPAGSVSILNRKIRPGGLSWIARVTAHTGGGTAVTLDAVPETLAAGTTTVIFQDEYQLATDLGLLSDNGLWSQDGQFVELVSIERLLREYPDPPVAGTPARFCARIDRRRIRLSSYPDSIRRYEYNYTAQEADPSGSGDLTIPQNFRWLLADGGLYFAYLMKSDKRAAAAKQDFERGILEYLAYDRRLRMGVGSHGSAPTSPYR